MDPVYRIGLIPHSPHLTDGSICVRTWTFDDLPSVEEASRDPSIAYGTSLPSVFSDEEGRAFIERQQGRFTSGEGLSLVIAEESSDQAAGYVGLFHRQQAGVVGLGYWTVASHRRQGHALGAAKLITRWALNLPGIHRIEALVHPSNTGSNKVLEGAGFVHEGLLRNLYPSEETRLDMNLFSLIRSDIENASGGRLGASDGLPN